MKKIYIIPKTDLTILNSMHFMMLASLSDHIHGGGGGGGQSAPEKRAPVF